MKLSENLVFHDKLKHIEIKYHYIRDMVQRGAVKLQYVATCLASCEEVWLKKLLSDLFDL